METVDMVYNNAHTRISTSTLNEVLQNAVLTNEPPMVGAKRCKIYYITQGSVAPPTFVLFVNDINLMETNYLRYLENNIRKAFNFEGTPIRITMKCKKEEDI
jgi:GTP-binding protein